MAVFIGFVLVMLALDLFVFGGRKAHKVSVKEAAAWSLVWVSLTGPATPVMKAILSVLPDTARRFARAIVMPNLKPPVTTVGQAHAYRERILKALPSGARFEPLMTLFLTDLTPAAETERAKASGFVHAVKYYPAGATTNSEDGVTDLKRVYSVFAAMEKHDLPLLLHGEVTDDAIDVFDREAVFIERHLAAIVRDFPKLRIVLEHVTTKQAVEFVLAAPANVAATVTAHHLLFNRSAMFAGGIRPHLYCLPVLKRELHRQALLKAATGGSAKFFSVATARRTPGEPRNRAAVAPVSTRRMPRLSCTPKCSSRPGRLVALRPLRVSMAPISTACRATRGA